MIDDSTVRETVARVAGENPAAARAAAIAAHARDPLRHPVPASSGDESGAPAPEAAEDTGGRESAEEQPSSTREPEPPRETTGAGAGAEVAALVAEAAGLPAGSEDLLSGDVANMRRQAERLAEHAAGAPQPSAPLSRRPSPSLRPGYVEPAEIDAAEIARQAREG